MTLTTERHVRRWPSDPTYRDRVAVEEPLEIRVEGRPLAVTMRTPGHDIELTVGFLVTEGVIETWDDLAAVAHVNAPDQPTNTVDAILASGVEAHAEAVLRSQRNSVSMSSCGLCGKASIDNLHLTLPPLPRRSTVEPELIAQLPSRLALKQYGFAESGGLHAAALFDATGSHLVTREDIGRHNAVDKVIGWAVQQERSLEDHILLVSSRAGFEIVQKALAARVSAVAALGAASSLAIDLAVQSNIALFGFVRDHRMNEYVPEPNVEP
jgi:FdhD protein